MKIFKNSFFILVIAVLILLFAKVAENRNEVRRLIEKYHDSETAVQALHSERFFRLYQIVHKKEPLVSPVDLAVALNDFSALKLDVFDIERVTAFAKARHLLPAVYPADFVQALVRFENSFPVRKDAAVDFPVWNEQTAKNETDMTKTLRLSLFAYLPPDQIKDDRYSVIEHNEAANGFSATAFKDKKDGSIIIAYRGSDEVKDLDDAFKVAGGETPEQFKNALDFYKKLRKKHSQAKIYTTGHSLGGSLAQLVAASDKRVSAYACSPVGIKRQIDTGDDLNDYGNIFNLVVSADSVPFFSSQPGKTFLLKSEKTDKYGDPLHPHSVLNCLFP